MGKKLPGAAFACGIAGLPLWLMTYAWIPFALMDREGELVRCVVVVGEVGALAAGALGVGLGVAARRSSQPTAPEHRLASRGLVMGSAVLALILVPNIVGSVLTNW